MKSIFDAAHRWKIIASNPMDGVESPKTDRQEKRAIKSIKWHYTTEELHELILALEDEPIHWRLYFPGSLMGGFRRGELLGVEWSEIEFNGKGGIHVTKQISLTEDGKRTEAEPKTEESAGFVSMPEW